MSGRIHGLLRWVSLVALLGVIFVGVATATGFFHTIVLPTRAVEEPLSGDPMGTATWVDPFYPNGGTPNNFTISNQDSTEDYTVKIVLESFDDVDGTMARTPAEAALAASSAERSAFISEVTIDGRSGHEVDLLNDGVAYYHSLPANTTQSGAIVLAAHEDIETYGGVSMNVTFYRVTDSLEAPNVRTHDRRPDTCSVSGCHAATTAVGVHREMGTSSDCVDCHGRSMQDLHMSCVAGCHDGYPIRAVNETTAAVYAHGPTTAMNTDMGTGVGVVADYYCGANCHGSQLSSSHTYIMDENYCGQCHPSAGNQTIRGFHDSLSANCIECHGKTSEAIHHRYTVSDTLNECTRCHANQLG